MRSGSPMYWNAYPALLCAGAVAGGIVVGAALPFWGTAAAAGAALLAAGAGVCRRPARLVSPLPLVWTLAVLLALGALGAARYRQDRRLPPAHVGHLVAATPAGKGPQVILEGRIAEAPRHSSRATRFLLAARRLFPPAGPLPGDTLAGVLFAEGRVEVALRPSAWERPSVPFPTVEEGDLVRLRGRLQKPPRRRNPAGFDYGAYLRRRGIYAAMSVYAPSDITVTGRRRTLLEKVLVPARHHVERQLARHVPGREARAVLRALLLGDRSHLAGETKEHFARSGLMHLLAVSGLHVLLVGWLFYQVLRPPLLRLGLRWRTAEGLRTTLTLGVLAFYVLLTGAPTSATRALVMAALLMGATLAQRPARALNALGAAAVGLLLWRPAQLFDAGFQLSFAAVAAIVTLVPVLQRLLPPAWEEKPLRWWIARSSLTTLAATLGTLPVLLVYFGRVPFAGLLLNLWAIPLTAVALLSGLAVVGFGGWAAPLAAASGATAGLAVRALLWTARAGNALAPWTVLRLPRPSPWLLAESVLVLLAFAAWRRPRLRWRLVVLVFAVAVAGCWQGVFQEKSAPHLDALFFDVGHGDAVLLSLPAGGYVLIDAGGRSPATDAGRNVVLPHLKRYGIDRLDAVVLSHPDGDHLGGLPTLLRHVRVGRFITGGDSTGTALFAEMHHLLDSLRVPVRIARAGDTLRLGPNVEAEVLAPTEALIEEASENDASVALRLRFGATHFLFTGDAEAETEALLARSYGALLQSDVIKIGHHSSPTSSIPTFVSAAVAATTATATTAVTAMATTATAARGEAPYAVASSGHRFGLPNRSVLARWRAAGARTLATADEGALWLRSDGERVWRVRWRQ